MHFFGVALNVLGLGRAHGLIVSFLDRGQVGQHLLDRVFLLNRGVLIIVQALQLVLRIELGHDIVVLDVDSGLRQLHQHQAEIATWTSAHAAAIQTGAAAQNARRHQRGEILRVHRAVDAHRGVQVAQSNHCRGNRDQRPLGSNFGVVLGFPVICRPAGAEN